MTGFVVQGHIYLLNVNNTDYVGSVVLSKMAEDSNSGRRIVE